MTVDPNLMIAICSGILSGGISYGAAMARITKLEFEQREVLVLLRSISDKLNDIGNRATRLETLMEKDRT